MWRCRLCIICRVGVCGRVLHCRPRDRHCRYCHHLVFFCRGGVCRQNLGAGNYRRLQRGVVQITCAAGVVTLLIGLVATVFCRPLLGLFSSDPAVLDAAVRYTWWVLPFIWTYAVFNCMMSFVNGTGAVKYTTVVNLLILWAVRIPAAYILHALGYGTSSMACVSLSYAVGLVAMLGYFLTPEWGKLRRKAKELGDAVTAETEPTL